MSGDMAQMSGDMAQTGSGLMQLAIQHQDWRKNQPPLPGFYPVGGKLPPPPPPPPPPQRFQLPPPPQKKKKICEWIPQCTSTFSRGQFYCCYQNSKVHFDLNYISPCALAKSSHTLSGPSHIVHTHYLSFPPPPPPPPPQKNPDCPSNARRSQHQDWEVQACRG